MYSTLRPGASTGLHTHEGNCEIIYVVSGTATFHDVPDVCPLYGCMQPARLMGDDGNRHFLLASESRLLRQIQGGVL